MIRIEFKDYKQICKVCYNALEKVRLNPLWESIYVEFAVGFKDSHFLHFKSKDRLILKERIKDLTGYDPSIDTPDKIKEQDYLEASDKHSEKMGTKKPRQDFVEVRQFLDGNKILPKGYEGKDYRDLNVNQFDAVIVVENFSVFVELNLTQLPESNKPVNNVLMLYRGDSVTTPDATKRFLGTSERPVYAFVDFDPAGWLIAKKLRADYLIAPDLEITSPQQLKRLLPNKEDQHYLQAATTHYIPTQLMKYDLDGIAITQEYLVTSQLPLTKIKLEPNEK